MFLLKRKKHILFIFQNITQIVKNKLLLSLFQTGERWHYLLLRKLLMIIRGIASKINDDFYCLSCLHSFRTKDKCKFDIKVCENKVFWNIIMPSEETKI